jgi:miniconductance mechanosensitive channel
VSVYLIVIVLMVGFALLDAVVEFFASRETTRTLPIKGFIQSAKLLVFLMSGVLMLSLLLNRSPLYFLSGLGALTAVLLLVFKDALLGLVAGVQISVNRMIQIGDWIEMPKYGADGDVIDVSLTTVKVQNWDKTVTTVPTYALISDPVKNWRAMAESGGRRIKRSVLLDMQTFQFVDEKLLAKLLTFRRLHDYLQKKIPEIDEYNRQHQDDLKVVVNGRRLTNVGCFRAYVLEYLKTHPHVRQDMTLLVRQLQPTAQGLPLEIYVFSADTRWANYEALQADIFDHLLTVIPEFELRVYQSPSSLDVAQFGKNLALDRTKT